MLRKRPTAALVRCASCSSTQPLAFVAGGHDICELCGATFASVRSAGLDPEKIGWRIRLDPELTARLGGVVGLMERAVAPIHYIRSKSAVVLVSGVFDEDAEIPLFQTLPVLTLVPVYVVRTHLDALLSRLGPFVPSPKPLDAVIAGIKPDPVIVSDWQPSKLQRRGIMPIQRVADRLVVLKVRGQKTWPKILTEAAYFYGLKGPDVVELEQAAFDALRESLPWGKPLQFEELETAPT